MKNSIYSIVMIFTSLLGAQVGIGTDKVEEAAILEIESDGNKGLRIPEIPSLGSFTPSTGTSAESLLVYNSTDGFNYWSGSSWIPFSYTLTKTTPWYTSGTSASASGIFEDIYLSSRMNVFTDPAVLAIAGSSDEILYLSSSSGDPDVITLGNFSDTNQGFNLAFGNSNGSSYTGASLYPNNSNRWDLGSIRFFGSTGQSTFGIPGFSSYAEIKVRLKSNTSFSSTTMPAELIFEVNEDGDNNPDKIFGITWASGFDFNASESYNNWDFSPSSNTSDMVVGIITSTGELVKIPKSLYLANSNRLANSNATYKTDAVYANIANDSNSYYSASVIVKNNTNVVLKGLSVFSSNEKAKSSGLTNGMVYSTKDGQLKIVD